jgi:DNA-directed RNA polymerase specialized sigma24 family protein
MTTMISRAMNVEPMTSPRVANDTTASTPHVRVVPERDPDRELAERLHRRERAALDLAYRQLARVVREAAAPIVGAARADDVVQEVFFIVMQRPQYVPLDGLEQYFVRLARSVARERSTARRRDVCLDDLDAIARRRIPRPKRKKGAE